MMRTSARAKGRGNRIVKPTCHILLTVGDKAGKKSKGRTKYYGTKNTSDRFPAFSVKKLVIEMVRQ